MPYAIAKERQRIRKEISEFDTLIKYINERAYKTPHLINFKDLLEYCKKALLKDCSRNLDTMIQGLPITEKSSRLREFRSNIKRLRDLLFRFLLSSEVPRELYCLCDLFLEYNKTPAQYLICISEEIATLPLTYILKDFGFDVTYPSFWNRIKRHEFHFVQVTSRFKDITSAIDWPIVLHEISHIICQERNIDDIYLEHINVYRALRTLEQFYNNLLPPQAPLVEPSTKKLYMTEYLADFFVTKCLAGVFGWRFLENYVDLSDIFEIDRDRAHPPPDQRIQRVTIEIRRKLKNPEIAMFLERELAELLGRQKSHVDERLRKLDIRSITKDVNSALDDLIPTLHKDYEYALTSLRIKESIRETQWFKVLSKKLDEKMMNSAVSKNNFNTLLNALSCDFADGVPIIADPSTLYHLVMLRRISNLSLADTSAGENEEKNLSKLLADSIRLYSVQRTFLA